MASPAELPLFGTVLQIFLVDLLLSGDNAVVVGLVCQGLPGGQRRLAMWLGIVAAILLRVAIVGFATFLLELPGLKLLGGLALAVIAVRLALGGNQKRLDRPRDAVSVRQRGLGAAVAVIVLADLVMSADNMIAIAAIARGDLLILFLGLALSIPLLMWGSMIVVALLRRYRPLVVVGAALLGWIGGGIAIADPLVAGWVDSQAPALPLAVPLLTALFVLLEARFGRLKAAAVKPEPRQPRTARKPRDILSPQPPRRPQPAAAAPAVAPHDNPPVLGGLLKAMKRAVPHPPPPRPGVPGKAVAAPGYVAPTVAEAAAAGVLILAVVTNPVDEGKVRGALAKRGFAAEFARDGATALEMLAARRYGLLMVDCYMLDLDGFALARRIREEERSSGGHLPIIGLLGYVADRLTPGKCLEAGMDDSISKAFLGDNIERLLLRWLPAGGGLRRLATAADEPPRPGRAQGIQG